MSFWNEITVLSVCYNSKEIIGTSLRPFLEAKEVIVVDNASADGSVDYLRKEFPEITLIESGKNLGYGSGFNLGLEQVKTPFLFAISPDADISVEDLKALYDAINLYEGAALVSPALEVPRQGIEMWVMGPGEIGHRLAEADCVGPFCCWFSSAAITLYRTEALKKIGGFDENIFLYQEDLELALRIHQAGYSMVNMPNIVARHINSGSTAPSVKQHWRKDWNYWWSYFYVLNKHGEPGEAKSWAWKIIRSRALKVLFYLLVLDRKRFTRDYAGFHSALSFLLGKKPKRNP